MGDLHRRHYARVSVSLPVEFSLEGEGAAREGSALDLGAGGMRLVASYDIPAHAVIQVKFRLPGSDRSIRARGRAVVSAFLAAEKTFHHGIAFMAIDPDDRGAVLEFIEAQEQRRNR
jgi:c-di-GMP-binding flagellar brake protein YcgR